MRAILVTLLGAMVVVGVACDRGWMAPVATSTPTATAMGPAQATSLPTVAAPGTPLATATAEPRRYRAAYGIALIDTFTGLVNPLHEGSSYADTSGFEPDGSVWIFRGGPEGVREWRHFDSTGNLLEASVTIPDRGCVGDWATARFRANGREYAGRCGPLSPDGEHLFYTVDIDPSNVLRGRYEAWLLRLADGAQIRLTDRLLHCGGCDAADWPAWSPSGRFVIFSDTYSGEGGVISIADVETGSVSPILTRAAKRVQAPRWSPVEDVYAWQGEDEGTRLTRPSTGLTREFKALRWPAGFDPSGRLLYEMVSRVVGSPIGSFATAVLDIESGAIIARWDEGPRVWPSVHQIASTGAGQPAGMLEGARSCRSGVLVYHPSLPRDGHCLPDSAGGMWGPGAEVAAFARRSQPNAAPETPAFFEWELVLLDVPSLNDTVLLQGLRSEYDPPQIEWSPDGRHVLVEWPPIR